MSSQTQILFGRVAKTRTQQVRPPLFRSWQSVSDLASIPHKCLGTCSFRTPDLRPRAGAQETVLEVQLGLILSKLADDADSLVCGTP